VAEGKAIHRVNVNFAQGAYEDLSRLARETGKTKAEVLQEAIALQRWFHDQLRQGGRILVERADHELREVIPRA
jgi:hypothetical protein